MNKSSQHHGNLGATKNHEGRFETEQLAREFCNEKMRSGKWERMKISFDKTPKVSCPWIGVVSRSAEFCANMNAKSS